MNPQCTRFLFSSVMDSPLPSFTLQPLFFFFDQYPERKLEAEYHFILLLSFFSCSFSLPPFAISAVISCLSRLWLPDQAADGSGRRSAGACLGGGSRPHSHMWCLWSLHLCSAWQWGKLCRERRREYFKYLSSIVKLFLISTLKMTVCLCQLICDDMWALI